MEKTNKKETTTRFWVENYYDQQKQRIQTGNRIGSYVMRVLEPDKWNKKKEDDEKSRGEQYNFAEIQKLFAKNQAKFTADQQTEINQMFGLMGQLEGAEKMCLLPIKTLLKREAIYTDFLADVKGVGPVISAGLISYIGDPGRFDTISKVWAYAGLHVIDGEAARRKKGQQANWNSRFKVLCWKAGESFVKTRGFYRDLYDKYRLYEDSKHPDLSKGHRYARAKRKTVKVFLSHLWVRWRELEGLPVSKPYCEEYLDHKAVPSP